MSPVHRRARREPAQSFAGIGPACEPRFVAELVIDTFEVSAEPAGGIIAVRPIDA